MVEQQPDSKKPSPRPVEIPQKRAPATDKTPKRTSWWTDRQQPSPGKGPKPSLDD